MDTENEIQTTVRVPKELHQRVTKRVSELRYTKERTTINDAFLRGIELWLGAASGSAQTPSADPNAIRGPEIELVADLLLLLRSGSRAYQNSVLAALNAWKENEGKNLKPALPAATNPKGKKTGAA